MSANSVHTTIRACRICLNTKYSRSVSFDEGDWVKMYEYCFSLFVTLQDFPRLLCNVCAQKMQDFAEFKKQTCNADKLWRTSVSVDLSIKNKCLDTEEKIVIKEEDKYGNDAFCDDNNITYEFDNNCIKEENESEENLLIERSSISFPLTEESLQVNVEYENNKKDSKKQCRKNKNYENNSVQSNFVCQWCKRSFEDGVIFKEHILKNKCKLKHMSVACKKKAKNDLYYCGLCNEESPDVAYINDHVLNAHSSIQDLACKLCDYIGRDFADMESHRYYHQPNELTVLTCSHCSRVCRTSVSLQFHYRSVHLNKPGGWCSECNKTFRGYFSFRNHEKLHKTSRYICDYCGLRFLVRSAIIYHIRDHMKYKSFMCDLCGKNFKRKSGLKSHIQYVHEHVGLQKCTHCTKTFKSKNTLRRHLRRLALEKKFQCEICSKLFITQKMLSNHMIWHSDDRPYTCQICGNAYKAKGQLTIHNRKHTGNFPFKCTMPQCIRSFASSNQLKVHLTVHSGVKRYKCQFCERSFHNRSNVISHCNKQHNVRDVVVVKSSDVQYPCAIIAK